MDDNQSSNLICFLSLEIEQQVLGEGKQRNGSQRFYQKGSKKNHNLKMLKLAKQLNWGKVPSQRSMIEKRKTKSQNLKLNQMTQFPMKLIQITRSQNSRMQTRLNRKTRLQKSKLSEGQHTLLKKTLVQPSFPVKYWIKSKKS